MEGGREGLIFFIHVPWADQNISLKMGLIFLFLTKIINNDNFTFLLIFQGRPKKCYFLHTLKYLKMSLEKADVLSEFIKSLFSFIVKCFFMQNKGSLENVLGKLKVEKNP